MAVVSARRRARLWLGVLSYINVVRSKGSERMGGNRIE